MKYFNEIDWTKMKELKEVHEKYDFFLMIQEQGVKEYVPFYKVKEKGIKQSGLSESVKELKKRTDEAWKRMKRKPIQVMKKII